MEILYKQRLEHSLFKLSVRVVIDDCADISLYDEEIQKWLLEKINSGQLHLSGVILDLEILWPFAKVKDFASLWAVEWYNYGHDNLYIADEILPDLFAWVKSSMSDSLPMFAEPALDTFFTEFQQVVHERLK